VSCSDIPVKFGDAPIELKVELDTTLLASPTGICSLSNASSKSASKKDVDESSDDIDDTATGLREFVALVVMLLF
jgi:hypothetical protein